MHHHHRGPHGYGRGRIHFRGPFPNRQDLLERLENYRRDLEQELADVSALIVVMPAAGSIPCRRPRRELRSPFTAPTASSGTVTSSSMIGSSSTGSAFSYADLNAIEPAILNAISEESTVWYEPSTRRTRRP